MSSAKKFEALRTVFAILVALAQSHLSLFLCKRTAFGSNLSITDRTAVQQAKLWKCAGIYGSPDLYGTGVCIMFSANRSTWQVRVPSISAV